jgi:hypothetical protein
MLDTIVYVMTECNTTTLATPGQNVMQAARRSSHIRLVQRIVRTLSGANHRVG